MWLPRGTVTRRDRPKALSGDRAGQHSIRIDDQWRVYFVWSDGNAYQVEIVDYHQEKGPR